MKAKLAVALVVLALFVVGGYWYWSQYSSSKTNPSYLSQGSFKTYQNEKYSYSIEYPAYLIPQAPGSDGPYDAEVSIRNSGDMLFWTEVSSFGYPAWGTYIHLQGFSFADLLGVTITCGPAATTSERIASGQLIEVVTQEDCRDKQYDEHATNKGISIGANIKIPGPGEHYLLFRGFSTKKDGHIDDVRKALRSIKILSVSHNGTSDAQALQTSTSQLIPYTDDAQFKLSYPPEYSDIHTSGSPSLGVTSFARKDGSGILVTTELIEDQTSCYLNICDAPLFKNPLTFNGVIWDHIDSIQPFIIYRTIHSGMRVYVLFPRDETRIQEILKTFAFIK